ncbi:MAG: Transcription factor spt20 [Vezdaea acicularis]|nr:MAG: Transcription factor spt20 [Vezdaea acicularis]
MATAAVKPAQPLQKLKRPPPPALQTAPNGLQSATSSPSPSLSAKRPPSSASQTPYSASSNGPVVNGSGPRVSNRQRRESQRPGEQPVRSQRNLSMSNRGGNLDWRALLKNLSPQPYAKTTEHVLKKFRESPPSLVLHLHQQNFRFDQQDGSFPYSSPMKIILEHIKLKTLPHDMMDDLLNANVRFYDGCLIVQIHDHRTASTSTDSTASKTAIGDGLNAPFSIHRYNSYITPSPYAPYPNAHQKDKTLVDPQKPISNHDKKGEGSGSDDKSQGQKDSMPAPAPPANNSNKTGGLNKVKTFTTVLHPTALSQYAEMVRLGNTPIQTATTRKQSQHQNPVSQPPTPLTAVPSTPLNTGTPPAKRQKMMLTDSNYHTFESDMLKVTADSLYLQPAYNAEEAWRIIDALRNPLHEGKPPAPKTRKRTVAEVAADEALAAEEERFMLIMDERLSATGGAGGLKVGAGDGQAGAASFDGRFSRFITLEHIKALHDERKQKEESLKLEEGRRKQQEQVDAQRRKEQEEMAKRQQLHESQQHAEYMRREQVRQNAAQQQQQQQQQQQAMQQEAQRHAQQIAQQQHTNAQNGHGHPAQNHTVQNLQQQQQQQLGSPGQRSPVVRNGTPHSMSSPLVGNGPMAHGGVPMNATSSSVGGGSPPRPTSAAQALTRQISQQAPSRNGTPIAQSTPNMPNATPIINRHLTPGRMNNGSPAPSSLGHSPVAMPNGNQAMTPQELALRRRQIFLQQQQQQQHGHPVQPMQSNGQMSPQQIAALQAAQVQRAQQHMQMQQQNQQQQNQQQNMQQQMAAALARQQQQQHLAQMQQLQSQQMMQQQSNQPQLRQQPQQQFPNGASRQDTSQFTPEQIYSLMQAQKKRLLEANAQQFEGQQNIPPERMNQIRNWAPVMTAEQQQGVQLLIARDRQHQLQQQQQHMLAQQQMRQQLGINGMPMNGMGRGGGLQ